MDIKRNYKLDCATYEWQLRVLSFVQIVLEDINNGREDYIVHGTHRDFPISRAMTHIQHVVLVNGYVMESRKYEYIRGYLNLLVYACNHVDEWNRLRKIAVNSINDYEEAYAEACCEAMINVNK